METIVDLLEDAAARFADRNALGLRMDDGTTWHWTYTELLRRSRIAAWRLRAIGLQPGDRVLTWSPSTPALPAAYFGAMYARPRVRPARRPHGARHRRPHRRPVGRRPPPPRQRPRRPRPARGRAREVPDVDRRRPVRRPRRHVPARLGGAARGVATSEARATSSSSCSRRARRATPKGVILTHANVLAGAMSFHGIINPMEHRIVSLLPLSHALEQAVSLYYALNVGADVLYVRSRNPRVIFDSLREHRVTSMVLVPQVLDLFWSAIEREVEKQGRTKLFARLRSIARRLPYPARRLLFRSVHSQFGGGLRLFATAGAFLPPALQQAWEDMGVVVLQGYGATETFAGAATTMNDHPLGLRGLAAEAARDADRRGRRDPVPRPEPHPRLLERPRGDRGGVHRRRLVHVGRPRRLRRAGPAPPPRAQEGHHRPAQRVQRVPRGPRERAAGRRDPRLRGDRDEAGAHRGRRAGAGHARGPRRPARDAGDRRRLARRGPARDRCRRQGREPVARARTSGSPAGASGPRPTSRARTRSR